MFHLDLVERRNLEGSCVLRKEWISGRGCLFSLANRNRLNMATAQAAKKNVFHNNLFYIGDNAKIVKIRQNSNKFEA